MIAADVIMKLLTPESTQDCFGSAAAAAANLQCGMKFLMHSQSIYHSQRHCNVTVSINCQSDRIHR